MIKNILLVLGCFALGLVIAYFSFRNQPAPAAPSPTPAASPSTFSVDTPPSKSLKATIISSSGDINWQSRSATEPAQLTSLVPILQGEQIATAENGRITIQIPNASLIKLSPNSEVYFAQTLPVNIVYLQNRGSIRYEKLSEIPVSVRIVHLLIKQNSGSMIITLDDETVNLMISKGSATIAYNDADAISQVLEVAEGQQMVFDDETREVSLE